MRPEDYVWQAHSVGGTASTTHFPSHMTWNFFGVILTAIALVWYEPTHHCSSMKQWNGRCPQDQLFTELLWHQNVDIKKQWVLKQYDNKSIKLHVKKLDFLKHSYGFPFLPLTISLRKKFLCNVREQVISHIHSIYITLNGGQKLLFKPLHLQCK